MGRLRCGENVPARFDLAAGSLEVRNRCAHPGDAELFDGAAGALGAVVDDGEERAEHGSLIFAIEIRINTRLAEAPAAGQTIFQYDRHAKGAEAYKLLAGEFLLRARG